MNTTQVNQATITDNDQVLILGEFSPEDAREIINHMITEKINYHGVRSFSNKVRFGEVDYDSERRIVELTNSRNALNTIIQNAKDQGKTLKIESNITIEII